jgi:hypothetical protein
MTQDQKTELEYLIDLLREASKWNVEQGDDALRLEVDLRINNILNSVEVEGETKVQGEPDNLPAEDEALTNEDFKALEAARLNEHLASPEKVDDARKQWESSKVRCSENGRLVWHPRSECQKVPRDNSKGGPAWKWQWMGPKDKKAQEDEMWAEHEAGNAE